MIHLDFTETRLEKLVTHYVGNKLRDGGCKLSENFTQYSEDTYDYIVKYFILPLRQDEMYSFNHPVDLGLNDIFILVKKFFDNPDGLLSVSQDVTKILYEKSLHPKIKGGEFNVGHFTNIIYGEEVVDGLGFFKSESNVPFLKMNSNQTGFDIRHDFGFEIKGIDKGCFILNTNRENGYEILIVDKVSRGDEAQYWKKSFLNVKALSNEFHQTNEFLGIAKAFITNVEDQGFDLSKADKIDLLNKSMNYFKEHDTFDKNDFQSQVIVEPNMIQTFEKFDSQYRLENKVDLNDSFQISQSAVKKQARVFKSILKLDKNFHIYIHGNRDLIEKGVDNDGRKFYKIYFENET